MDDPLLPVEHSWAHASALRRCGVAVELHLFEEGGHGFALREDQTVSIWPELFLAWAARQGFPSVRTSS